MSIPAIDVSRAELLDARGRLIERDWDFDGERTEALLSKEPRRERALLVPAFGGL